MPVEGIPLHSKDYFSGSKRDHLTVARKLKTKQFNYLKIHFLWTTRAKLFQLIEKTLGKRTKLPVKLIFDYLVFFIS